MLILILNCWLVTDYLGYFVISNDYFSDYMETSNQWISSRSGILERRFVSEDETELFEMNWNSGIQKFQITGIDTTTVTVDKFITNYYESIEFPSLTDVVKNTFNFIIPVGDIVTVTPGGKSNPAFDSALNKLMKTIDKITGYCGDPVSDLKQNPTELPTE